VTDDRFFVTVDVVRHVDPVRSSIGGGVAATAVLTVFLLALDLLFGGANPFVFATFTSLCAVGGQPYCELGSPTAAVLTFLWYVVLFAVAWPLFFGGFTWALPGESGVTHGVIFGLVLWAGYAVVVLYGIGMGGPPVGGDLPMQLVTLVAYLVYGVVLGSVYDRLAEHRTFSTSEAV
jgi:hypothetical protein